jgi:hypothetical protein
MDAKFARCVLAHLEALELRTDHAKDAGKRMMAGSNLKASRLGLVTREKNASLKYGKT